MHIKTPSCNSKNASIIRELKNVSQLICPTLTQTDQFRHLQGHHHELLTLLTSQPRLPQQLLNTRSVRPAHGSGSADNLLQIAKYCGSIKRHESVDSLIDNGRTMGARTNEIEGKDYSSTLPTLHSVIEVVLVVLWFWLS